MSALTKFLPRERRTLVADALLVAAAAGGASLGLLTLLSELVSDAGWYEPASVVLMVAVVLVCPWVAWRLHGRRTDRSTVPGAVIGVIFGGLVVIATTWLVGGIAQVVTWVTRDAVSLGVAAVTITGIAVAALLGWLDTDAVRDLVREHRHVRLDIGRLVATGVALVTVGGTLWWAALHPDEAPGELLEFSLAFGIAAATVALGADLTATPEPPTAPAG